jgi:hypothetical protein
MKFLLIPFLILSLVGFLLSVSAHVLSLFGQMPPGGQLVMTLHVGIFVVWIPTVLLGARVTKNSSRKNFWKIMLSGCPTGMRYVLYGLFGYAFVNFILFVGSTSSGHQPSEGLDPGIVRGFSGHWMVFYWAAFSTLCSVIRSPQLFRERKCSNGHAVSLSDVYCPTCGKALVSVIGAGVNASDKSAIPP